MIKSDYTAKMIGQFRKAMVTINELKKENKWEETLSEIDAAFKEIFRLGISFFNSFSEENVLDVLTMNGNIEVDRCIITAKLLEEQGIVYENLNDSNNSFYSYERSLSFFLEAFLQGRKADLEEFYADIDVIQEKISDYELSTKIKEKIFEYNVEKQWYTKAEDMLYEIISSENVDEKIVKEGVRFYEKLLTKDDEELEQADLPREEVEIALSDLKNKFCMKDN